MPQGWSANLQRSIAMSAKEELLEFILNLTDEQVEKLFKYFSESSALPEEPYPLYPLEQTLQTQ